MNTIDEKAWNEWAILRNKEQRQRRQNAVDETKSGGILVYDGMDCDIPKGFAYFSDYIDCILTSTYRQYDDFAPPRYDAIVIRKI